MLDKSQIHLVPIQIIDLAESALDKTKQSYQRDIYFARLQAIKEYVDGVISKYDTKKAL